MIPSPVLAIGLPFLEGVGAPELIIILVIVLVLFGPKRLPELGKSLGKTMKSMRDGLEGKTSDDEAPVAKKTEADEAASEKADTPKAESATPSGEKADDAAADTSVPVSH